MPLCKSANARRKNWPQRTAQHDSSLKDCIYRMQLGYSLHPSEPSHRIRLCVRHRDMFWGVNWIPHYPNQTSCQHCRQHGQHFEPGRSSTRHHFTYSTHDEWSGTNFLHSSRLYRRTSKQAEWAGATDLGHRKLYSSAAKVQFKKPRRNLSSRHPG